MLVLSRQTNESLVIGDDIVITVLAIEGDQVKLGIDAPRQIPVLRQELWQAIREQNAIAEQMTRQPKTETIDVLRQLLVDESKSEDNGG
jgi:carbon storage regulator